jgi:hypothetical protein
MFDFTAVGFIEIPQVKFSSRSLVFEYFYHPIVETPPKLQMVVITNISKVHLHLALTTAVPFTVSVSSLELDSGQSAEVLVTMNHTYRKDLVSHKPRYGRKGRLPRA